MAPDGGAAEGGPAASGSSTVMLDMSALTPCKEDQHDCETRCAKGSADNCLVLGFLLASGKGGGPRDPARAMALFTQACGAGLAAGCGGLAEMYLMGEAVGRDLPKATALYQQACEKGDALSCGSLAGLYVGVDPKGPGIVPQDGPTAAKWYQKSCDLKDMDSCLNLGALLSTGAAGTKDAVRAHDLFATACDADSALACTLLADGYARGDGVPKDAKRAGELYAKGCKGGIARACKQAGK